MKYLLRFLLSLFFVVFAVGAHAQFTETPGEPVEVTLVADDIVDAYPDGSIYSHRLARWITDPVEIQQMMGPGTMVLVGIGGGALGGGLAAWVTGGNGQQILAATVFGGIAGGAFTIATMGGAGTAVVGTMIGVGYTVASAIFIMRIENKKKEGK